MEEEERLEIVARSYNKRRKVNTWLILWRIVSGHW